MPTRSDEINTALSSLELFKKGLDSITKNIDDTFFKLLDLINKIHGRVIITGIGKSSHIARKIAATLASTGTPSLFVHPSEANHGDMGMITEDDMVIMLSNSGESSELFPMIDYCKRFKIPLVAIARSNASTITNSADIKIILESIAEATPDISAPTTSTTQMLVIGDLIAILLYKRRGFTNEEFKYYHPGGKIGAGLLTVADLMHTGEHLPIIKRGAQLKDAIIEITKKRLGCVAIVNNDGEMCGVFTDGDLRRSIYNDIHNTTIDELMNKAAIFIGAEMFASEALRIMNEKKITNLFVVDNNKPVGVIHLHDILKAKVA